MGTPHISLLLHIFNPQRVQRRLLIFIVSGGSNHGGLASAKPRDDEAPEIMAQASSPREAAVRASTGGGPTSARLRRHACAEAEAEAEVRPPPRAAARLSPEIEDDGRE